LTRPYSLDSYRLITKEALASGYAFAPFSLEQAPRGKRIYLRHDVDYSLEMALRLAEVNAELGVQGTFFLLLRSQIYNLLSEPSLETATRIRGLGQHIGFHFPLTPVLLAEDGLLDAGLQADFEIVRSNLPMVSSVCSWHNPTSEGLERYVRCPMKGGLVNVYSAPFFREIAYYSDSNMRHPVEAFMGFVGQDQPAAMQLVLHPLNWVAGGSSMGDVFSRTWPYIIREREYGVRLNHFYADALPDGMPEGVLQGFAEKWYLATQPKKR